MRWPRPPVTIPVQSLWPVGSSTGPYRISDRVEPYHSFYIVCYLRTKYTNVITCEKQYEMLSFRLRIHILLHKTWISLFTIHPPWFDKLKKNPKHESIFQVAFTQAITFLPNGFERIFEIFIYFFLRNKHRINYWRTVTCHYIWIYITWIHWSRVIDSCCWLA